MGTVDPSSFFRSILYRFILLKRFDLAKEDKRESALFFPIKTFS